MDQQAYSYDPQWFNKKKYSIQDHGPILMQKMKIYTTSIGVKNRRCQQMIHIYQDGGQHN
jgi:hypothetical protein